MCWCSPLRAALPKPTSCATALTDKTVPKALPVPLVLLVLPANKVPKVNKVLPANKVRKVIKALPANKARKVNKVLPVLPARMASPRL